ncbi:MAG TPA: endonuclease domain-containing protein [Rhizomicrobium sp.]|nr:endonuclease domain-containing protein [Rhizomicrobium sp.]
MAKVARKTLSRARALRRKLTNAECLVWWRLRKDVYGIRFRRQHPIGPYIADFACVPARLIIEIDGGTHVSKAEAEYDRRRDRYLQSRGWFVLRLRNEDVYDGLDEAIERVCAVASARLGDGHLRA